MISLESWTEFKNHAGMQELEGESNRILEAFAAEIMTRKPNEANELRDFWIRGAVWAIAELRDFTPEIPEVNND